MNVIPGNYSFIPEEIFKPLVTSGLLDAILPQSLVYPRTEVLFFKISDFTDTLHGTCALSCPRKQIALSHLLALPCSYFFLFFNEWNGLITLVL